MLDHISIQCDDIESSARFYDAVLEPIGYRRITEHDGALGYGADYPSFWLGTRTTGDGFRESHLAFRAPNRAAVREFFAIALREGADALHEPRVWPEYHSTYYGAFVRDPDGNNIEAVCHGDEDE
jgi:catechol 2,3-dioxygenase-like lactoylglutathione lyase family enzyme